MSIKVGVFVENLKPQKVVVAMSGGVDSSVAALLLKQQGFDLTGVMLKLWSESNQEGINRCCTPGAVFNARRVAAILDIPFYVIDVKNIFYTEIVEHFIHSYLDGETPNPCIRCNQKIRWGHLLDMAKEIGASFLATGHYARIKIQPPNQFELWKGIDPTKDQSYMLSNLSQSHLKSTIFPLGELPKSEVRNIARKWSLPVAEKEDSQDLCFVGDTNYRNFLKKYAPNAILPGEIVDQEGNILGTHDGLSFYTIGQRKGLRVSTGKPVYVIHKDKSRNQLVVTTKDDAGEKIFFSNSINWISGIAAKTAFHAMVKIRYRSKEIPALIKPIDDIKVRFELNTPLMDITPGQQVVIYSGEKCLGGGKITQVGEEQ